jgi:hypothetical protein
MGNILSIKCFLKHIIEQKIEQEKKYEEEDVSSYRMTSRKREECGI